MYRPVCNFTLFDLSLVLHLDLVAYFFTLRIICFKIFHSLFHLVAIIFSSCLVSWKKEGSWLVSFARKWWLFWKICVIKMYFSTFILHRDHLGILIKCSLWSSISAWGLGFWVSNKPGGSASAAGLRSIVREVESGLQGFKEGRD